MLLGLMQKNKAMTVGVDQITPLRTIVLWNSASEIV